MLHRYAPAQPSTHMQKTVDLGIGGKIIVAPPREMGAQKNLAGKAQ
jgi:hypothetical protein